MQAIAYLYGFPLTIVSLERILRC